MTQRSRIQFLAFDGCPLAGFARDSLRQALAELGEMEFEEIDILDPATPEEYRGWGSPTILVDGADIAGGTRGNSAACRTYPGPETAPDVKMIVSAIRKRISAMRPHAPIVEQLRRAIAASDIALLGPIFAEDVQFGPCVGRPQILQYLGQAVDLSSVASVEIDAREDRLLITVVSGSPAPTTPHVVVFFVHGNEVVELQVVEDLRQGMEATPASRRQPWPGTRATLNGLAAVFPVRDLSRALDHYRMLGFSVSAYDGGGYGYAERDGMNLHFSVVSGLDPSRTTSAIYLSVDDADALFAEWKSSGASGQFFEPEDTDYGLREGAHVDLDGNLLRFGSRLENR